jgi:dUTP pyrophosphatase
MKLRIQKLHPAAQEPTYGTDGAACFDLRAVDVKPHTMVRESAPGVFRTGLAFEVPEGFVMLIFSRSGHGFKNGVRLANCVGVIDSDYRG